MFERALRRVAADSPRDAVIDAYTAFEMYLAEVPVRARYDREAGADVAKLRAELKPATHSAERAIGAARAVASLVGASKAPEWKGETTTNVRNDAIHAGKYPTVEQAERLCIELAHMIQDFEAALGRPGLREPAAVLRGRLAGTKSRVHFARSTPASIPASLLACICVRLLNDDHSHADGR